MSFFVLKGVWTQRNIAQPGRMVLEIPHLIIYFQKNYRELVTPKLVMIVREVDEFTILSAHHPQ